jgi:hypothetical protein
LGDVVKHAMIVICTVLILSSCNFLELASLSTETEPKLSTYPPDFLEECTIRNVEISSHAIFDETIGINDSVKLSLNVSEDDQQKAILGFERRITKIDQVWIPKCMEGMKRLTIRGIEKTLEGFELYYAGEVSESIPAFREGSSLITNGTWHIAILDMCLKNEFDDNCYHLVKPME